MSWKTKIPYRLIDFTARVQPSENYVIGVKRISDMGGAGTWIRIDEQDNPVEVQPNYFVNHPSYQFNEVEIVFGESEKERNIFVEVPKFYVKSDGNSRYWISPTKIDGFHCHPAFMSNGKEIDSFYIGKYQGYMHNNKLYSIAENIFIPEEDPETGQANDLKIKPTVYMTFEECKKYCKNWNDFYNGESSNTVNGFHMMNIFEYAALQWLALIEIATTNAAMPVSAGGYGIGRLYGSGLHNIDDDKSELIDSVNGIISSGANFHGIVGLWGNIWQYVDGITTTADCKLVLWDTNGMLRDDSTEHVLKYTDIDVPFKKKQLETWSPGVTCGFYRDRLIASGYNYDTTDMFIPDFSSLTSNYENGCFSDGVYGRIKGSHPGVTCVGGGFDTGDFGGLYCYKFDIFQPPVRISENIVTDDGDRNPDVGGRLCFAEIKRKN